ncbi:hypothetical protein [Methylomonas fluvii]|uniref:DUF4224 domain-containing protein n=1 Tax=Methylomonas fluvii TaxID=1854564 RepID=A0ABR9D9R9_9GAMM|nr:hypothetical protein [Methylomonas fluvii]MBD9359018.1 hypothetical protein [Methylomonas fluvii]CAD6871688.1 hypothetical protein [Methylomonas fluvii]
MTDLVSIDQLKIATGYDRPGDIERCLRKNGVRYLYGQGGKIFTTIDAINAAMGLKLNDTNAIVEEIDFID